MALVLESFVTAIACLCASSFRPNSNIRELEHNIHKALPKWNPNFLKIVINSNDIFTFSQNSMECVIPDEDTLDLRFMELESKLKKLENLNKKLTQELNSKTVQIDYFSCQDLIKYNCNQEVNKLNTQLAEAEEKAAWVCRQKHSSLSAKILQHELKINELDSILFNCSRDHFQFEIDNQSLKNNLERQQLQCTKEKDLLREEHETQKDELESYYKNEISKLQEEIKFLKIEGQVEISNLLTAKFDEHAESERKFLELKTQLEAEKSELNAEISKLRKESELLKAKNAAEIAELQKENKAFQSSSKTEVEKLFTKTNELKIENDQLRNATILKTCQNSGKEGLNNLLFCQQLSVFCDHSVDARYGSGWMLVAQRRNGKGHFYQYWNAFSTGFGKRSAQTEFFVGLEELYTITNSGPHELLFVLTDEKNETRYAHYDNFLIGNEREQFQIKKLGNYEGDAGDSFSYHAGQKFTTLDRDNDKNAGNCAKTHTGAWWYKDCHESNLFGLYKKRRSKLDPHKRNGMIWSTFHDTDDGNLISMQMYLRPRK